MKTRKELPLLTNWIFRYVDDHRRQLAALFASQSPLVAAEISFPLIDMHNAIATFLRAYTLSSLSGAYKADGTRVTAKQQMQGHRSALTFAVRTIRPRMKGNGPWQPWDEPTWHDTRVIIKVLNSAGCSNAMGVNSALSINSRALQDLTVARNFLAHRNESTARKLRGLGSHYGVGMPNDPLTVLFAAPHGTSRRVVEEWLDDISTIFSLFPR